MKLRWKILITIILAVLAVLLQSLVAGHRKPCSGDKSGTVGANTEPNILTVSELLGLYEEYNLVFFNGKLPDNTVVDWAEHSSDNMAKTTWETGHAHIGLNPKYCAASRVARLLLLHEMCHVATSDETDYPTKFHGPRWRACMLKLEMEGANRALLIDGLQVP